MNEPLVQCVPNFSEGRDSSVIAQITAAIVSVDGVLLLDVDPGKATPDPFALARAEHPNPLAREKGIFPG